jgi:hypothetical protein
MPGALEDAYMTPSQIELAFTETDFLFSGVTREVDRMNV